ncbi:unnamed protein product [Leuciscus chuanchicus]
MRRRNSSHSSALSCGRGGDEELNIYRADQEKNTRAREETYSESNNSRLNTSHTMSRDQSDINNCCQVGRFPAVKLQADCSEVKSCAAVGRNSCSLEDDWKCSGVCGQQVYGCFKPVCQHNPCRDLTSCHDHGVQTLIQDQGRRPCGNEVSVSFPVNKWKSQVSCKNIKDDCNGVPPCGRKVIGRFQVIHSGVSKEAFCKPVCERNTLMSCHDQDVKNVSSDCKGIQSCGNKMIGHFPVVKLDSEGPCCKPTHARAIDNMM